MKQPDGLIEIGQSYDGTLTYWIRGVSQRLRDHLVTKKYTGSGYQRVEDIVTELNNRPIGKQFRLELNQPAAEDQFRLDYGGDARA